MKKFISGFLCCAVLCSIGIFASNSLANQPIRLFINHKEIQCDVPPQIINGRVMVPARFVAEALGAEVEWSDKYNTVFVYSKNKTTTPNNQTMQQQQLKELTAYSQKVDEAIDSTVEVLDNSPTVDDLSTQIKDLASLEEELVAWGTLDEYKEIKRLYIQCINQMGKGLIYTRSAVSGIDFQVNSKIAENYIYKYQETMLQISAELKSLKLKGLLEK